MLSVKKFKVITLGCRTNTYESQAYVEQLLTVGCQQAGEEEEADLCIVNTCTVTQGADASSRHAVRSLSRAHPKAQIVVTGCLAQRAPKELEGLPGVTHVISNQHKENLLEQIFPETQWPEFSTSRFTEQTRAFVKVQDGCNSFCSYCILPYVRGRSRSRRLPDIVKEIQTLIANGHKEIVLTGINVGDFDGAPQPGETPLRLVDLVKALDKIQGLERLRISSIDPDEVDDELLDAVLNGRTTCHSMHIVLQSGSNVILKRMNRKYTREIFLDTIDKIRKKDSDFTFTTDVIVGFPGESESDFQDSLDVMSEVHFAKVHMFPYSRRDRTRAALFPHHLPSELINERKAKILQIAERQAFSLRERYVGRRLSVLFEQSDKEKYLIGHTPNFLPVFIEKKEERANDIRDVEILSNHLEGLFGKVI